MKFTFARELYCSTILKPAKRVSCVCEVLQHGSHRFNANKSNISSRYIRPKKNHRPPRYKQTTASNTSVNADRSEHLSVLKKKNKNDLFHFFFKLIDLCNLSSPVSHVARVACSPAICRGASILFVCIRSRDVPVYRTFRWHQQRGRRGRETRSSTTHGGAGGPLAPFFAAHDPSSPHLRRFRNFFLLPLGRTAASSISGETFMQSRPSSVTFYTRSPGQSRPSNHRSLLSRSN